MVNIHVQTEGRHSDLMVRTLDSKPSTSWALAGVIALCCVVPAFVKRTPSTSVLCKPLLLLFLMLHEHISQVTSRMRHLNQLKKQFLNLGHVGHQKHNMQFDESYPFHKRSVISVWSNYAKHYGWWWPFKLSSFFFILFLFYMCTCML